jgi:hypothetical protein
MGFNWEPRWWTPEMYGLEQVMGYDGHGLRQLRLYFIQIDTGWCVTQKNISTTVKIWHDTSEIFDIGTEIWGFLRLTANFEPCVTLGRFNNHQRDVWPLSNFAIDRGVRDTWMKYYSTRQEGLRKSSKKSTFRISAQVRNSLMFRVEPEHTGMQVACHADQCTDDICLKWMLDLRIEPFAIYWSIKFYWWHSNLATNSRLRAPRWYSTTHMLCRDAV